MKKAAILAILGAVAAGAAAVCAKVIRDRQNEAEDEYTECPCGCDKEEGTNQTSDGQPVPEEFFQQDEPDGTPEEEAAEQPEEEAADEPVEQPAQEPQETDSDETI